MSYAHILGTMFEYSSCMIFSLSCMINVDHGLYHDPYCTVCTNLNNWAFLKATPVLCWFDENWVLAKYLIKKEKDIVSLKFMRWCKFWQAKLSKIREQPKTLTRFLEEEHFFFGHKTLQCPQCIHVNINSCKIKFFWTRDKVWKDVERKDLV